MIFSSIAGGRIHQAGRRHNLKTNSLYRWLLVFVLLAPFVRAEPPPAPSLQIGVLEDNYPFSYLDSDGQIKGFAVDFLAEVEKVSGLNLERRSGPTQEINSAFEAGELHVLQSYARSAEREKFALFSTPYLWMSGCIFVHKNGPPLKTLSDLKGRRVLVHAGSKGEQVLRAAGLAASIVHVGSVEESLRKLNAGEGDATLASRLSALATAQRLGLHNIEPSSEPIYEVDYCFAVRKEHADLLRRIDEGILIVQQPGGAHRVIYRKWFGHLGGYTSTDVMIAVTAGLSVALLVAVWAILRQRRLNHQIRTQAAQLKASEERYRGVFESTLDGILVLQPTHGAKDDFIVEQANPAAQRLFKTEALPWIGRHLSQLLPDGESICPRIVQALAQRHATAFEHEFSSGENPLWLRISVGRLGTRPLVVLANITETRLAEARLKKHEEQFRQNQKLEAIGTLASGIAHDFNNILAAILGNAEIALLDLAQDHPARPCIDDIRIGSERAKKLVRQILTFSRKSETHREIVAVQAIIQETLQLISTSAPKNIEFAYTPASVPLEVEADSTQLHQVFLNLCTNAVQALKDKAGRIEIDDETVDLDSTAVNVSARLKPGRYVHVSVRDNGCGMAPEILQRIFEPFFTTKPVGEGTGLGLSVVHGIMQNHGGDITVYSKPGQGTVFHLYLPASRTPQQHNTTPPLIQRGGGQHIMVVDDEAPVAQATSRLLEKMGYVTTTFLDPNVALAAFRQNPNHFKAIICDLTMPLLNGLDLAGQMAKTHPFILMSGYLSEEDKDRALGLGVRDLITKPLNLAALSVILANCLKADRS